MTLNLTTTTKAEELLKICLEDNASETLAEKINNGVEIVKDNIKLINKKNLQGFMKYATEEARKLAEKGATGICIDDDTVYGWAIHYFEEDSIEGTLYNLDGTEYKKPIPTKTTPKVEVSATKPVVRDTNTQQSLFDLMEDKPSEQVEKQAVKAEEKQQEPQLELIDKSTGEIFDDREKLVVNKLNEIFNGKVKVR